MEIRMKALIAISVSREWVETEFLMQMGSWKIPQDWQVKFGWFRQFTAQERHNVAIHEAKFNYDRVLFMDTDQIYPPNYIEMMLDHDEPVVTGLNVSRYQPFEFTIYKVTGECVREGIAVPEFESMAPKNKRYFECDMTGTGALMVDPKILDKLSVPYFKDVFDKEGCYRIVPDDFWFCWQLYKAGVKITVDRSIVVKHVAKVEASPFNGRELKSAWDKVNSGHGYWKDGKR
jgi:hypothetical protein